MTKEATIHHRERTLTREVADVLEPALPGVEVLAVELIGTSRFCVFLDRVPTPVDLELCEEATGLLRGYLAEYTVDVSSPGLDRPLRTAAHFAAQQGLEIKVRTERAIDGKSRYRGLVGAADDEGVTLVAGQQTVKIPYDAIVRANLIDEG